jgi:hypothetical protein
LPLSLLAAFRASAARQGISIHDAASRVVSCLQSFTHDDLNALPEPPREFDTPKISLYIGWRAIDVLASVAHGGTLSNSRILRRVLFGLIVRKSLTFVQHDERWKLQTKPANENKEQSLEANKKSRSCA